MLNKFNFLQFFLTKINIYLKIRSYERTKKMEVSKNKR